MATLTPMDMIRNKVPTVAGEQIDMAARTCMHISVVQTYLLD